MNDELNKLFSKWQSRLRHQNNINKRMAFVRDGAMDKEKWEQANPKIVFLEKEAYGHGGGDERSSWCLGTLLREEWGRFRGPHWLNVGRWTYGIQHTNKDNIPSFPDDEVARNALFDSAVVNIKKSGGSPTSNDHDLKLYVEEDGDLIKEQIDLLNPDVIVFCSTWHLVKELFGEPEELSTWTYQRNNQKLLEYYHPAARMDKIMMFFALRAIYQKSLQI